MKDFNWTSFTRRIAVKADMGDLYAAWTKSADIEKWFLGEATFFDAEGNPVGPDTSVGQNGSYAWRWFLYDDTEQGKITEANGKDRLQFTFAGECLVDVTLTAEHEYVVVELTQKNIPTDDDSKQHIRLGCHTGWSFYLLNLKSVYEGGLDLRNKDTRLKPMLNN